MQDPGHQHKSPAAVFVQQLLFLLYYNLVKKKVICKLNFEGTGLANQTPSKSENSQKHN